MFGVNSFSFCTLSTMVMEIVMYGVKFPLCPLFLEATLQLLALDKRKQVLKRKENKGKMLDISQIKDFVAAEPGSPKTIEST